MTDDRVTVLAPSVLAEIREAVRKAIRWEGELTEPRLRIRSDEVVWVSAPARVDLAGGWSDTPPYCLDHGGTVLNTAITLNGQAPLQVIGKRLADPVVRLTSIDLANSVNVANMGEMLDFTDPSHWTSLPKAAFAAAGILPESGEGDLQAVLSSLGGGINLTLFSAVPAGSGLGTSSILGSAVIACLARMVGAEFTRDELFNRTLYLEQLMTTGGGWQDQIGGVLGGTKLIHTEAGPLRSPLTAWTDLTPPGNDFASCLLLYYTGYTRRAKDILHRIVRRYLGGDAVVVDLIARNRELARQAKQTLDARRLPRFGELLAEVWETQKQLDPGISDDRIDSLVARVAPYVHGAKLAGAGGGGFLFMVCKDPEAAHRVHTSLTENPPNGRARFYDFAVDHHGLKVTVL